MVTALHNSDLHICYIRSRGRSTALSDGVVHVLCTITVPLWGFLKHIFELWFHVGAEWLLQTQKCKCTACLCLHIWLTLFISLYKVCLTNINSISNFISPLDISSRHKRHENEWDTGFFRNEMFNCLIKILKIKSTLLWLRNPESLNMWQHLMFCQQLSAAFDNLIRPMTRFFY